MTLIKRSKDKEEVRRIVLQAASRAFMKNGIKTVRMDDIAVLVSMSKRTIYELFHDKEHLLLEILKWSRQEMSKDLAEIAPKAENVLEVIFAFYKRKLKELLEMNPQFLHDLRKYPNVLNAIREENRQCDVEAMEYFYKGVEEGIFRNDINFGIINEAMSLQFELFVYSDLLDSYPLVEAYRELTFLHIRGICTEKGLKLVETFLKEASS